MDEKIVYFFLPVNSKLLSKFRQNTITAPKNHTMKIQIEKKMFFPLNFT